MGPDGAGLSCPGSSVVAYSESAGVKFENPTALETLCSDSISSFRFQSLTEELRLLPDRDIR
jgi:hypothetical protein